LDRFNNLLRDSNHDLKNIFSTEENFNNMDKEIASMISQKLKQNKKRNL
jgi:hypothetical protein